MTTRDGEMLRIDAGTLTVMRFGNGAIGITCAGQAIHLRPDEAVQLASIMERLFRDYTLETP